MTKAELIRKFAKRNGIPSTEAKVFFEIFLSKCASRLEPGDTLKFPGFGFIQLRTGRFDKAALTGNKVKNEFVFNDVLIYYPINPVDAKSDTLIFNVPLKEESNYNSIDGLFSLSFGKPIIPLQGTESTEYFIPPSGVELRKLMESKTDKILSGASIIRDEAHKNEFIELTEEYYNPAQLEIDLDTDLKDDNIKENITAETELDKGNENIIDEVKSEEEEISIDDADNIPWDFGIDLEKEIEKESLIDTEKEEEIVVKNIDPKLDDNLSWDFDKTSAEYDKTKTVSDENEDQSSEIRQDQTSAADDDFELVKSLTSEFKVTRPKSSEEDKPFYKKFQTDESALNDEEGFTEVVPKSSTIVDKEQIDNKEKKREKEEELFLRKTSEKEPEPEEKKAESNEIKTTSAGISTDGILSRLKERELREKNISKGKTSVIFLVAAFIILAVGGGLYYFLKNYQLNNLSKPDQNIVASLSRTFPVVIERTYEIPVTYPYEIKTAVSETKEKSAPSVPVVKPKENKTVIKTPSKKPVSKSANNRKKINEKNITSTKEPVKKEENKTVKDNEDDFSFESLPPPAVGGSLRENIYQYDDGFAVQVSSWKNKNIAQKEAERYTKNGLRGFVEQAFIPGRGTWYRVRIGYFKTAEEAENYLKKNK